MKNKVIAFGLLLCIGASIVPFAAIAGEKESKNTAIAATAVSAYLLSQKKSRNAGIVGAAGSVYLWKKYDDSKKARRHRALVQQQRSRRQARYARARYQAHRRYVMNHKRSTVKTARVVR